MIPECQEYEEFNSPDAILPECKGTDWFVQPKMDGIWARVEIDGGPVAKVYSKTKQLKGIIPVNQTLLPFGRTVLLGEFMFGSQWSTHPDRAGKVYVFDCVMQDGIDLSKAPYKHRYRAAAGIVPTLHHTFSMVPCYALSKLGELWISQEEKFEGWIVRNWNDSYQTTLAKLKYEIEDDFVILGFVEGKNRLTGTLGAIRLGQYDESGKLVYVQDCGGGFTDDMRRFIWSKQELFTGQVVLIRGKGRFHDGALRHPNFVRLRDDKVPLQCTLKRKSR